MNQEDYEVWWLRTSALRIYLGNFAPEELRDFWGKQAPAYILEDARAHLVFCNETQEMRQVMRMCVDSGMLNLMSG